MSRSRQSTVGRTAAARALAIPTRSPDGWSRAWRFGPPLALAAAAIVFARTLQMFFAQDDVTFLSRARGLEATPWSMARPLSEGWVWRTLSALFGLHPLPYHAFNFALHL